MLLAILRLSVALLTSGLCAQARLHLSRGLLGGQSSTTVQGDVTVNTSCIQSFLNPLTTRCGAAMDVSQLRVATSAMFHSCVQFGGDLTVRRLRVLAGTARLYPELQRLGSAFTSASGIPMYLNRSSLAGAKDADVWTAISQPPPVVDTEDVSGGVDVVISSPSVMHLMDKAGKLLDLSPLVTNDPQLQWFLINSGLREQMVVYGNKVAGIPVTSAPTFLFYHAPTFARDGLEVPVTWDQVLALAEAYNGKDIDGDGQPDFGICMTPANCHMDGALLLWVFASYVQTHGSSQGSLLDPLTGAQLADSSAMAAALEVMRRMRKAGPLTGNCSVFEDPLFLEGRCLLSLTSPITFKAAYAPDAPAVYASMRGAMGIAAFPGSTKVLDRASGSLVACDKSTCPLATVWTRDQNGVLLPVNQPAPSTNVIAMVNAQSPVQYQYYAYAFLSYLTSSKVLGTDGAALLLSPKLDVAPMRSTDLTEEAATRWVAAGYHPRDVDTFFRACRAAMNNPNQVLEPRFPGNLNVSTASTLALLLYTNATTGYRTPPVSIPMSMISNTLAAVIAEEGGPVAFLDSYRRTLNRVPLPSAPSAPSSPPPLNGDGGGGAVQRRVIAIGVTCSAVVFGGAVAAAAVVVWRWRRRNKEREVSEAPQAGPDTTLLVTDIQSSTSLWEQLDPEVMNRAVSIHHAIMRKCIAEWRGYESATEGDSFIVAFHNPTDAFMCALEAQQALLSAPWPPELLQPPSLELAEGEENPLAAIAVAPLAPASRRRASRLRHRGQIAPTAAAAPIDSANSPAYNPARCSTGSISYLGRVVSARRLLLPSPVPAAAAAAAAATDVATKASFTCDDGVGNERPAASTEATRVVPTGLFPPFGGPSWRLRRASDSFVAARRDVKEVQCGPDVGEIEEDSGRVTEDDGLRALPSPPWLPPAANIPPQRLLGMMTTSPCYEQQQPQLSPQRQTQKRPQLVQDERRQIPTLRTPSFGLPQRSASSVTSAVSAVLGLKRGGSSKTINPAGRPNIARNEGVHSVVYGGGAAEQPGSGDDRGISDSPQERLYGRVASCGRSRTLEGYLPSKCPATSDSESMRTEDKTLAATMLASIRVIRGSREVHHTTSADEPSVGESFEFTTAAEVTALTTTISSESQQRIVQQSSPPRRPPSAVFNPSKSPLTPSPYLPLSPEPILRGLRVRMGMWTGVPSAADVTTNAASGRTQYSGQAICRAKLVADTAHGGMVVMSESSRQRLTADVVRASKHYIVYGGLHALPSKGSGGDAALQLHLYTCYSTGLLPRAVVMRPLRTEGVLREGALAAPVGHGTVIQMRVAGLEALLAWDVSRVTQALDTLHAAALDLLKHYLNSATTAAGPSGGSSAYIAIGGVTLLPVSATASGLAPASGSMPSFPPQQQPGLMMVVFKDAQAAVAWAAAVRQRSRWLEWSEELLGHELCEEVWFTGPAGMRLGAAATAALSASATADGYTSAAGGGQRSSLMSRASAAAAAFSAAFSLSSAIPTNPAASPSVAPRSSSVTGLTPVSTGRCTTNRFLYSGASRAPRPQSTSYSFGFWSTRSFLGMPAGEAGDGGSRMCSGEGNDLGVPCETTAGRQLPAVFPTNATDAHGENIAGLDASPVPTSAADVGTSAAVGRRGYHLSQSAAASMRINSFQAPRPRSSRFYFGWRRTTSLLSTGEADTDADQPRTGRGIMEDNSELAAGEISVRQSADILRSSAELNDEYVTLDASPFSESATAAFEVAAARTTTTESRQQGGFSHGGDPARLAAATSSTGATGTTSAGATATANTVTAATGTTPTASTNVPLSEYASAVAPSQLLIFEAVSKTCDIPVGPASGHARWSSMPEPLAGGASEETSITPPSATGMFATPPVRTSAGAAGGPTAPAPAFPVGFGLSDYPSTNSSAPATATLQLLHRGLRLRFSVASGALEGGLVAGDVNGQVSYKGKAVVQAGKLLSKARVGQICVTAELAGSLPAALAEEVTIVHKL
ncbi:hypothetical protein Agub_g4946 [Astrephomene gubernaculifera]|uniref:Guanylate cyclase domain-containing protein n=1 Tax=Astrephomene gubernaculifera TaxID=47775 RepID=A0AAD3DL33_9CHLO|nr:hypothetical protein Agub_g4946 [Astrephomene gubernaculifera]